MEVLELDAGQVRAHALARARHFLLVPVHLHPSHAHGAAAGQELELLVAGDRPGDEAARDDRTEARDQECAVDRQARDPRLALLGRRASHERQQGRLEVVEPLARHRRDRNDGGLRQGGALQQLSNVGNRHCRELGGYTIDLRDRDDAARQPEHADDLEVLAGLRHHGLVGRDDEEHRVDPARAREHVADEPFVARNVDERHPYAIPLGVREAEIDRDPAPLLLGQPVGVDPGQRLHERRLAVVDVSGRADEESASRPERTA